MYLKPFPFSCTLPAYMSRFYLISGRRKEVQGFSNPTTEKEGLRPKNATELGNVSPSEYKAISFRAFIIGIHSHTQKRRFDCTSVDSFHAKLPLENVNHERNMRI